MITIAVSGVLLGVAVPGFQQFRLNGRLSNAANDLLSAITLARTEAIKRQRRISVCPTTTPELSTAVCSAGATAGWIIFDDADGNCTRATAETLLGSRTFSGATSVNSLRVKADGNCLQFAANGFRQTVVGMTTLSRVALCDNRGMAAPEGMTVSAGRGILIAPTGRARITRTASGGLAEDVTGPAWAGATCP